MTLIQVNYLAYRGNIDVGTYGNIAISVSDGIESDSLDAFNIVVNGPKVLSIKVDLLSAPLNETK